MVSARMHALLARELITACGGLDEAAGACRLKTSRLAQCQDPAMNAFLPVDVVAELEAYCGRPLYSRALVEARPSAGTAESLAEEACEVTEGAAGLQRLARLAARGDLTPSQKRAIEQAVVHLQDELRDIVDAVDKEGRP